MRNAGLSQEILQQLITLFVAGTPARTNAKLCGINFKTVVQWYHRLKTIIYTHVQKEHYVFDGAIAVDESYLGGRRKGKRGRGASGKIIVFGLYKRNGYVHTLTVSNTKTYTLYSIIKEQVAPDSIVYTDAYHSYDILGCIGISAL